MTSEESEFRFSYARNKEVEVSRIYDDGSLLLAGDPGPWIQSNIAHRLSVRILELNYLGFDLEKIGGSIGELAELTHLYIWACYSLKNVTNVLKLHSLRVLIIGHCPDLQELPQNMGDLINLTLLQLSYCCAIKSLPNSIAALSKLSTLKLEGCVALEALPEDLKVIQLKLHNCCRIQSIPRGLTNLESLDIQLSNLSEISFSNKCRVINNLPSLKGLRNLQRLCLHLRVEILPVNLDALPQLMLLDIHQCLKIKNLPCSLKKLHNLHLLNLPKQFRIETLPFDMSDSVIISVEEMHIRKTWEEIKLEIPLRFKKVSGPLPLVMDAELNPSPKEVFDWVYLSFKEEDDPYTLILNTWDIRSWVRFLDVKLQDDVEKIGSVIEMLPNLTHLYIQSQNLRHLPDTITRLTHLSLYRCHRKCLSNSMGKLSNLISLDLHLDYSELPAALDLLFSLEHLTLRYCEDYVFPYGVESLPHSEAKLSNLNTLELFWCDGMSLPKNLNITKLKLVCSSVQSLPTSLCHLEIVHHMDYCSELNCSDELETCLEHLVKPKTLSLTCYGIKLLPSIAGQQSLQTLLLKDCFNLRELMPNMGEFVELCTLNISGTRIKFLPECITKLPKLKHLVLPKCFKKKNLTQHFSGNESNVEIEFDGTDDTYYEEMGYHDSYRQKFDEDSDTSNEDNENTPDSVMELDDMVGRESGEDGINSVQKSSCQLRNPPEAIQGLGAAGVLCRKFSTGENHLHASHCSQNQVTENLSLGLHSISVVEDMITELRSDIQETYNFGEDRHVDIMNLGNEESTSGVGPFTHDMNNHYAVVDAQNSNNPHDADKKGNRQKKEITCEQIRSLMDEHIPLMQAARKLGVSRSTMKRRIKELGLGKWPSSRKKTSNCSKKKKINTMIPSGGELSQANMVERLNPAGPEYANESLDVIQHNTSDQVAPECDSIDHSTPNSTTDGVGELNVSTHRHMDVHESVHECMVGTEVHTLLGNVKDCSSSSSFDIKATYKDDIVRFKWSSTACLKELKEAVAENLTIELDSFKLKYQDEEQDWVLINSDEHLKRAFSLIKNNVLRLKVTDL